MKDMGSRKLTFSDNYILLHQPDTDLKFVQGFMHRDVTWENSGPGPVLFTFVMAAVCLEKMWRAHDNMLIFDNLW